MPTLEQKLQSWGWEAFNEHDPLGATNKRCRAYNYFEGYTKGCEKLILQGEMAFVRRYSNGRRSGAMLCAACASLIPGVTPAHTACTLPEKWKSWRWDQMPEDLSGWNCCGCIKELDLGTDIFLQFNSKEAAITADFNDVTGDVYCRSCAEAKGIPFGSISLSGETMAKLSKCEGCKLPVCNACKVCHTEDCMYNGYNVTTLQLKVQHSFLGARSQKIRGYLALKKYAMRVPTPVSIILSDATQEDVNQVAVRHTNGGKSFVRPCPTRPRHGFVESRPMEMRPDSGDELFKLLREACEKDETGTAELMVIPYIPSLYNAIVTPARVAVGPGNDGATAGHESISMPLMGVPLHGVTPELLKAAAIRPEVEDPYIEAVLAQDRSIYYTQIRAGVKIPAAVGADYIPRQFRVESILEASGDLLEWESQMKRIKPGTVVCHTGGSLISHYGVHCMQNEIPVMTSRVPAVGEVLEASGKVQKPSPQAVIDGLAAGVVVSLKLTQQKAEDVTVKDALIHMMVTLHNSGAMSGDAGYWIGVAVATMMRAGMAASHGEVRHRINSGLARTVVYRQALEDFFTARNTLGYTQYKFLNDSWRSGYGGLKWGACTEAIIEMDRCVLALLKDPSDEAVSKLVSALNVAVNQAHNGGWWLDKFIDKSWFDKASQQALDGIITAAVAGWQMRHTAKQSTAGVVEQWRSLKPIEVEPGLTLVEDKNNTANIRFIGEEVGYYIYEKPMKSAPRTYTGPYCENCAAEVKNSEITGPVQASIYHCCPVCAEALGWLHNRMYSWATEEVISLPTTEMKGGKGGLYNFLLAQEWAKTVEEAEKGLQQMLMQEKEAAAKAAQEVVSIDPTIHSFPFDGPEGYVGSLCMKCQEKWGDSGGFSKVNALNPAYNHNHGTNCTGNSGWYENGEMQFVTGYTWPGFVAAGVPEVVWKNNLGMLKKATPADLGIVAWKDAEPDKQTYEEPTVLPETIGLHTNVNEMIPLKEDDIITEVQGNLHKNGMVLHLQFRTVRSTPGYYSTNCTLKAAVKEPSMQGLPSFSGSEVHNYFSFAETAQDGPLRTLMSGQLGLTIRLNLHGMGCTHMIGGGENEPQEETQSVQLQGAEADIPF